MDVIMSEPVLALPNFDESFKVHTDVSDKAVGGVFVPKGHPVAFEIWKLKDAEKWYFTHKREILIIVHFL